MKVLIQDSQSKQFYTTMGEWVQDAREAGDFESYRRAHDIAQGTVSSGYNIMLFSTLGGYLFSVDQGKR